MSIYWRLLSHNKSQGTETFSKKEIVHRIGFYFIHACHNVHTARRIFIQHMVVMVDGKDFHRRLCTEESFPSIIKCKFHFYRLTTKMSISMQNALKTICKQFSFQCGPMNVFVCLLCWELCHAVPQNSVQRINYATEILIQVVGWFAPFFRFATSTQCHAPSTPSVHKVVK